MFLHVFILQETKCFPTVDRLHYLSNESVMCKNMYTKMNVNMKEDHGQMWNGKTKKPFWDLMIFFSFDDLVKNLISSITAKFKWP